MLLPLLSLTLALILLSIAIWASDALTRRRKPDVQTSPADYGLAFEEVAFPATDGVILRGWWIPAAAARGTVIFLHGHGGSMDPDVQYAPAFHAAGFNVLMFDFRAHGRSDGDRVSMGYFERRDLLGAIRFLAQRGINAVGLLGFSMGGVVALITAPDCPAVKAVVSDGGFARLSSAIVGWAVEHHLPRWLGYALAHLVILSASLRLRAKLWKVDPIRWVGRIAPRPIFFIHGERDPYTTPAEFAALVAAAGDPKEVWREKEAGHRTVDEGRPAEYRKRVVDFFLRWLSP